MDDKSKELSKEEILKNRQEAINKDYYNKAKKSVESTIKTIVAFNFAINQYKRSMMILILVIATFSLNAWQSYYITTYKPPVKYIPIYEDGTVIENVPLTEEFKTEGEMAQWLADASKEIFSYDYLNADSHGESIKKHFTPEGFTQFFKMYENSPDLSRVKNKKQEVLANVLGSPSKTHKGKKLSKNNYAYWEYKFKLRQVFYTTNEGYIPATYEYVAVIVRKDQREFKEGIAIHSLRVVDSSTIE
jgi:hypothetical protein